MESSKKSQYVMAVLLGLTVLFAQVLGVYQSIGLDFQNPKARLMQEQLLSRLGGDAGALSVVIAYVFVAIGAHVSMTVLALAAFRVVAGKFMSRWLVGVFPSTLFMLLALLVSSFWNRFFFPMSRVFEAGELLMVQSASPVLIWGGTVIVVGCIFAATTIQAMRYPKVIISLVVVLGVLGFFPVILHGAQESGYEEPDVIILGVDSLRPDFLPAYGFGSQSLTPSINRELSGMVVFEDVLTPLARTFVSYMSLLKGEGPAKHGARFNLYPRSEFSTQDNLAWRFKDRGYHTIMAMDESRFANFDQSFGFDEVVSPSVGALDFVVGGSYDLLATNLLLKLPVLNRFFVHLYGNRAAYRTYQLEDHPEKVVRALRAAPKHKPVFLINHLCFPHWPYGSSSLFDKFSPGDMGALPGFEDAPVPYLRALSEVDKQFSLIIEKLRDSGRLENAVVVVMSDHGEGFSMVRDGFHDLTVNSERRYFFGHGSFVLSDAQYRVVLGMQRYKNGRPEWQPRHVAGNVSLIDVAPTLMEEVGAINALSGFEGVSLRALMAAGSGDAPERFRFVESGIRSAGIEKADINESEVAEEMAYLYRIEPDLRFEIRPEFLLKNLAEKQRGVIRGSLGVATMPLGDNPSIRPSCWTVADYEKRTLSCVEYPAGDEVVAEMQHEVCQYFRNDPGFEDRWCQREEYRGQSRLNQ